MTIPEALALVSDIGVEETHADKFLPVELKIAAILLALWTNKVESSNLVAGLYASANDNRPGDVSNFLTTTAAGEMSSTVDDDKDKEALLALLTETAVTGADIVSSKTSVTDSANAARIIALLTSQIRWFSNSYFARIVTPAIQAAMQKNVSALAPLNLKEAIQTTVNRTILNTPSYWRLTSNATTGRAHHYGLLVGSRDRNIHMQRWKCVRDERTSRLCLWLDGKLFYTNRGIAELEKKAEMHPAGILAGRWTTLEEVQAMTSDELSRSGLTPPAHHLCRSTLVPVKS